jgi:hypothetical protein
MNTPDPTTALRDRLGKYLLRAYQALTDERLSADDALALARNVATTVTAEVDTMGVSLAGR